MVGGGALSGLGMLFLVLHVGLAVLMVGAGYVYPIILKNLKDQSENRVVLLRVMKAMSRAFTFPFIIVQPLTGAGLILTTHDLWNPFRSTNRWLFASIILFIVIFVLEVSVTGPAIRRMGAQTEAGRYDDAALGKDLALVGKVGPLFGILFLTITVLMIWKPGAPKLHF